MKIVHYFKYLIRNIFTGLKNLWIWFPIIWRDRNFSDDFLIDINIKKLKLMKDFFSNANNVNSDEKERKHIVSRINTAINLMIIVKEETYGMDYLREIEKIYGKSKLVLEPYQNDENLYQLRVKFEKDYTPEELEKIKQHEKEIFLRCYHKQKRAKKILWDFIGHNIANWAD